MSVYLDKQLCPESRLKSLLDFSGKVEIDPNVSSKLYYKSGLNMFKQFNISYNEGNWENALCIYLKYEKLFFEKIKQHPEYGRIPVNVKAINAANFRIIKPKAEHCKRELFKQYKRDYVSFMEEIKANKMLDPGQDSTGSNSEKASGESKKRDSKTTTIGVKDANKKEKRLTEAGKLDFTLQSEASFETSRRITEYERQKSGVDDVQKLRDIYNASTKKSLVSKKSYSGNSGNVVPASETIPSRLSTLKNPVGSGSGSQKVT